MKKLFDLAMVISCFVAVMALAAYKLGFIDIEVSLYACVVMSVSWVISFMLYCLEKKELERKHKPKRQVKPESVTLSDFDFELTNLRRYM